MASRILCDVLIDMLVSDGVKRIYGITGDSLNPITDAIRRCGKIDFAHVRHEEAAAFAASAEAQITGELAVCAGTAGPGNTHLINGLYDANRSGAPVLALASHIPTQYIGTDYFQETRPEIVFQDCSKFCALVSSAAQFPQVMRRAIRAAIDERGVATLVLPGDLNIAEIPESAMRDAKTPIIPSSPLTPAASEIDALANAINSAKRVALFCGHGAKNAVEEIAALSKKILSPVAYTMRGKEFAGVSEIEYGVGMTGLLGWGGATYALDNADLILIIGADFPYPSWIPASPKIGQIDDRKVNIGKRVPVEFGVWGDAKLALSSLLPKVVQKTDDAFVKASLQKKKSSADEIDAYLKEISCEDKIRPEYATSLIDKYADKNAVFVVPTGLGTLWGARYLTPQKGRKIIGSFTHGSMANELAMGIGAQAPDKTRQVVSLCGDGGLTMLMGELLTIVQLNLPIKIFVFNNSELGFINLEMMADGYIPFATNLKNPNFGEVAKAMGIEGARAENQCALEDAVKAAYAAKGAYLLDIITDPNAIALPPKISFSQAKNFSLSLGKLALNKGAHAAFDIFESNTRTFISKITPTKD